ncbi:LysM peptidoglycan-binding domain-containing protein [Streptomyces sp. NPDC090053]|uniref:LysM peptidoglycan-binding domain-containing protein n=1 Tax=Streptomyces sp. NPDC090053 TaxID=3365932 RepID=UPI0037F740CE
MRNSPAPARARTAKDVVRAAASLLALTLCVVGLPAVLGWATPLLWQSGHDGLTHLFDQQDSGGVFLLLLLAVGWVAWAQFTFCVVREIPHQLRGATVRAPRGFGVSQRAAAALIGSIFVLLPAGTALATPATAHTASTAAPVPGPDTAALQAAPSVSRATADDSPALYTTHTVRPAESLWSIAERTLGDGEHWRQIAELNKGRTMTDGTVFDADGFLQPGWDLRIPAPTTQPAPAAPATRSVTVHSGDSISSIAKSELGDADRYNEILEANDQVKNPNLIFPGQHLHIPGTATPRQGDEHPHPAPEPHHESGNTERPAPEPDRARTPTKAPARRASRPAHPAGPAAGTTTARPSTPAARPNAAAPPAAPSHTTPQPRPTTLPSPAASHSAPEDTGIGAREIGGIGLLLAASLLTVLSVKRVLQRRRRTPGENIAMPEETSSLEQILNTTTDVASVDQLDIALRTLAHHASQQGLPLPCVRGAKVTSRTVALLVEDTDANAMTPFTKTPGGWWTLQGTEQLLPPGTAARIPAPFPGLVTLGADSEGSHLLINLPHTRTLLLDGPPEEIIAVARALATEAATCSWSDQAEILTVGLGSELPTLLPQGRIRAVPHLRAALRDLGELLVEAHQNTDDDPAPLPWLLICAAHASEEDAWQLADALAAARDLPIALVLPAHGIAAAFPDAEHLHAGTREPQPCDALETDLVLQHLTDDEYQEALAALRTADEPAQPAEGPWLDVPGTGETEHEPAARHLATAAGESATSGSPFLALTQAAATPAAFRVVPTTQTDREATEPEPNDPSSPSGRDEAVDLHAPEISVLGPISVTGIQASGHGYKLAALAALVYFRPGRSADALCEAMDPARPWSKNTLQSRMSELRTRLGSDPDQNPYLPRDRTSGYRFSPKVRCDWHRFKQLAERGLTKGAATGVEDLEAALALVRGRPLSGGDHSWAAPLVQEMLTKITDVAHTIATWRRTGPHPDPDAARRAITAGLEADDSAELLYQDWILLDDQAGNRAGVLKAIETLQAVNRLLDVGMEPATERIIDTVLNGTARAEGF